MNRLSALSLAMGVACSGAEVGQKPSQDVLNIKSPVGPSFIQETTSERVQNISLVPTYHILAPWVRNQEVISDELAAFHKELAHDFFEKLNSEEETTVLLEGSDLLELAAAIKKSNVDPKKQIADLRAGAHPNFSHGLHEKYDELLYVYFEKGTPAEKFDKLKPLLGKIDSTELLVAVFGQSEMVDFVLVQHKDMGVIRKAASAPGNFKQYLDRGGEVIRGTGISLEAARTKANTDAGMHSTYCQVRGVQEGKIANSERIVYADREDDFIRYIKAQDGDVTLFTGASHIDGVVGRMPDSNVSVVEMSTLKAASVSMGNDCSDDIRFSPECELGRWRVPDLVLPYNAKNLGCDQVLDAMSQYGAR